MRRTLVLDDMENFFLNSMSSGKINYLKPMLKELGNSFWGLERIA